MSIQLNGHPKLEVKKGENILEAFIKAGHSPLYGCQQGECYACHCKIEKGSEGVSGSIASANGEVTALMCCSWVKDPNVEMVFKQPGS